MYLEERGIVDGNTEPSFPESYDPAERDEKYYEWSFRGWGGASGHDAPMIAYIKHVFLLKYELGNLVSCYLIKCQQIILCNKKKTYTLILQIQII